MPCHHKLETYLDAYLAAAGIREDRKGPIFRVAIGRTGKLSDRPLSRTDVWYVVRRRAADAHLETAIGCHTFRATGITDYLTNGGKLEVAQRMAGHSNAKTTGSSQCTLPDISNSCRASARPPRSKQHLACLRMLVTGQVLPSNPAHAVRGPRHSVSKGATAVMSSVEARELLDSMGGATVVGLRDRALVAVMAFTFARVSAVVGLWVEDYYPQNKRWWLRLREKNGKVNERKKCLAITSSKPTWTLT